MPDDLGLLSEAEKRQIIEKINKLWIGSAKNCPICQSNKWTLADHIVSSNIATAGAGLIVGGPTYPCVMLISEPCGYTIYFNAVVLGVVTPPGGKP
jgi:hypothetical protein